MVFTGCLSGRIYLSTCGYPGIAMIRPAVRVREYISRVRGHMGRVVNTR